MLQLATEQEKEFILSKAVNSANEGMKKENAISQEKAEGIMRTVLDAGAYYVVLRNQNETLTGWALLGEYLDYITEEAVGFIFDLYILPKYRGKGLSKTLVEECVKVLESKGYGEVRLNVYAANYAKEIYKKLGFAELQSIMYVKTNPTKIS